MKHLKITLDAYLGGLCMCFCQKTAKKCLFLVAPNYQQLRSMKKYFDQVLFFVNLQYGM